MSEVKLSCGGKINFFLKITGIRPDGYHLLESLFLPIPEPRDVLTVILHKLGSGIQDFSITGAELKPDQNILFAAYQSYARASGFAPALSLHLAKGIPIGAGLGGGSADAGLLLRWLQIQNPQPLAGRELAALALGLGADVPFFLNPGPCLVRGIGELIEPLDLDCGVFWLVLICPQIAVSTAWAFKQWDRSLTEPWSADKNHGSYFQCPFDTANSLEPVVFDAWPELAALKGELLALGAQAAGMSGSGSSLFGVFTSRAVAQTAAERLRAQHQARVFGPLEPGTGNEVGVSPSW